MKCKYCTQSHTEGHECHSVDTKTAIIMIFAPAVTALIIFLIW